VSTERADIRAWGPRLGVRAQLHATQSVAVVFDLDHLRRYSWAGLKPLARLATAPRQRVKLIPSLFAQGHDALREAGLAGCGIIRTGACHVEDEIRSRTLVPVLAEWDCTGMQPYVAIYRKTQPALPQVNVFVPYIADVFRKYNSA
jgi:DNA-binding transcriptional LysR family regulator